VVDVLSKMMQKAANEGLIKGLVSDVVPGGIISLQYVDDTILFVDKDIAYAENLKCILTCFELMSGMMINYHKSELVHINIDKRGKLSVLLGCLGALWGLSPFRGVISL
jgi:hypothetical protein